MFSPSHAALLKKKLVLKYKNTANWNTANWNTANWNMARAGAASGEEFVAAALSATAAAAATDTAAPPLPLPVLSLVGGGLAAAAASAQWAVAVRALLASACERLPLCVLACRAELVAIGAEAASTVYHAPPPTDTEDADTGMGGSGRELGEPPDSASESPTDEVSREDLLKEVLARRALRAPALLPARRRRPRPAGREVW
ncbi:hypothetical protein T492DRAFT_849822 [Pavlovales sp. CCMP2436]|nr:hypothetical protein T492DRAFT_849822 [Pavlovales sp. CCMP2436]